MTTWSPDVKKGTVIIIRDGFVIDGMVDFGHGRKFSYGQALAEADRLIEGHQRSCGYQHRYGRRVVFDKDFAKAMKGYDRAIFTDQLVNQDADEWRKRIKGRKRVHKRKKR